MTRIPISLDQYRGLCADADISPNYHPDFVEYYFAQLHIPPKIIACIDKTGRLVAAYPVLFRSIFPNPIHKRLLPARMRRLGDIGQPEILFPIFPTGCIIHPYYLAPVASPLLRSTVGSVRNISLRKISIANKPSRQRIQKTERSLSIEHGTVLFTQDLRPEDFSETYITLHAERWGRSTQELVYVRQQILAMYKHVFGGILLFRDEPVAALLAFSVLGKNILYVDFVNSGVKIRKTSRASAGSILLLKCVSKAYELAYAAGRDLRFSLGYESGGESYKRLWGVPENTYVAF